MEELTIYLNDTKPDQFKSWLDNYTNLIRGSEWVVNGSSEPLLISNLVSWKYLTTQWIGEIHCTNRSGYFGKVTSGYIVTNDDGTETLEIDRERFVDSFSFVEFTLNQVGSRLKVKIAYESQLRFMAYVLK
jgi:hypothetical protein